MHSVLRCLFASNEQPTFAAEVHRNAESETEEAKVRMQDTYAGLRIT